MFITFLIHIQNSFDTSLGKYLNILIIKPNILKNYNVYIFFNKIWVFEIILKFSVFFKCRLLTAISKLSKIKAVKE